jgi:pyridoxine/pyridoxamine 5'-phosphate oxidase
MKFLNNQKIITNRWLLISNEFYNSFWLYCYIHLKIKNILERRQTDLSFCYIEVNMQIPDDIEKLLQNHFDYPKVIIAQVATFEEQSPDIRSMGLFDIDSEGRLIFLTNSGSHKWAQLLRDLRVSVLLLNLKQNVQIIVRGSAELLTMGTSQDLLESYWLKVPHGAKLSYHQQFPEGKFVPLNINKASETAPDHFGVIRVKPTNWETLEIDDVYYPSSKRLFYKMAGGHWKKERLNAI